MTEPNILAALEASPPIARLSDPKTSHRAAGNIKYKSRRGSILRVILDRNAGRITGRGSTTIEIAEYLGITRDAVSPNMKPMERLGYVYRKGLRRNPASGNDCEIWHLTETGMLVASRVMPIAKKPDHICICKFCGGVL